MGGRPGHRRRRRAAGIVVAALVAGVVAAACEERGGGARFLGRTFLSESVTQDGRPLPLVAGTSIRLTFHDDGRLTASAGCNSMGGPVRTDGGRIAVADLATTEMGCDPERHAQDEWLAGFLTGRPAWRYEAPRLELRAGSTTVVLLDHAVADPDRPVEGTAWGLDGPSTATP